MAGAHRLHRLTLAAIRSAPESPIFSTANRVAGIPELRGDAAITRIFEHADFLAALDLPANFRGELELVATIVDGPRTIRFHPDAVVGACDQPIRRARAGLQADVGHANNGQTVPALGAHGSGRAT